MKLPRLRVSTLMLLVVIVTLVVLLAIVLNQWKNTRAALFKKLADEHDHRRVVCYRLEVDYQGREAEAIKRGEPGTAELRRKSESWRAKSERHRSLCDKYIYAALNPWLPVAPDPPEPE
jgi:hypothetical protein